MSGAPPVFSTAGLSIVNRSGNRPSEEGAADEADRLISFVNEVLKVPCQIVRQGRRVISRVLHWNPQLPTLFRLAAVLNC